MPSSSLSLFFLFHKFTLSRRTHTFLPPGRLHLLSPIRSQITIILLQLQSDGIIWHASALASALQRLLLLHLQFSSSAAPPPEPSLGGGGLSLSL